MHEDSLMDTAKPYKGVVVPMVTPFTQDGDVDLAAAARITEHLATADASVFVLGTTGEAPSIDLAARVLLVDAAVRQNAGRTITYAGISDNCLAVSVDLARRFADLGAEVVVAHVPSFYPLADEDVLRYFEQLADRAPVPLMLYNMPALCKTSLSLSTIDQLSHHPRIVGLKDSQNDTQRLAEALALWKDRPDFAHLTGCTVLSMTALSQGSDGIMPSAANLAPSLFCRLYEAVLGGDMDLAARLQARADGIAEIYAKGRLLSQSLPILKAMMHVCGFCGPHVLPPLRPVTAEKIAEIRNQWPTIAAMIHQP
jgi:4-hydroxy-tetrahydrodipicolinate synthase